MATYSVDVPDDVALRWSWDMMRDEQAKEIDPARVTRTLQELFARYHEFPPLLDERAKLAVAMLRERMLDRALALSGSRGTASGLSCDVDTLIDGLLKKSS